MTACAPALRHFLVQASAPALAPLAPHLSSLTHPLTVMLLPMSSNAMAERASTKQNARQITIIFFIADILLLSMLRLWAADYDGCFLAVALPARQDRCGGEPRSQERLKDHTSPPECDTRREHYTT